MRLLIGTAILASACSMPTLHDLDGRSVMHPALVAAVEHGWLVLDSSGGRYRAIVEADVAAPGEPGGSLTVPQLGLQVQRGQWLRPTRVAMGAEYCQALDPRAAYCRTDPTLAGPCEMPVSAAAETCFRRVRAEFVLPWLPGVNDTVLLAMGPRTVVVQWLAPPARLP